jgi:hypothetical protein
MYVWCSFTVLVTLTSNPERPSDTSADARDDDVARASSSIPPLDVLCHRFDARARLKNLPKSPMASLRLFSSNADAHAVLDARTSRTERGNEQTRRNAFHAPSTRVETLDSNANADGRGETSGWFRPFLRFRVTADARGLLTRRKFKVVMVGGSVCRR